MKKVFMLGLVALALPLTGCGTGVDVVDYNDKLVDLQNACYDAENVMMDAWDQENYWLVKTLYPTALEACTDAYNDIVALDAYDENSSLKDAFSAEIQLEVEYLQKVGEILAYWDYDELTAEQQAAEDALWEEADAIEAKIDEAYKISVDAQKAFADKYGYELKS